MLDFAALHLPRLYNMANDGYFLESIMKNGLYTFSSYQTIIANFYTVDCTLLRFREDPDQYQALQLIY